MQSPVRSKVEVEPRLPENPGPAGAFGRGPRRSPLPWRTGALAVLLIVAVSPGCFEEPPPPPGSACVDLFDESLVTLPDPPLALHFSFSWDASYALEGGGSAPGGLGEDSVVQVMTISQAGQELGQLERTQPLQAQGGTTRSVDTSAILGGDALLPGIYTFHVRTDLPNSECNGCQCETDGWGEEEIDFEVLACPFCGGVAILQDLLPFGLEVDGDVSVNGDFEFSWQNTYNGTACAGQGPIDTGNFTETITLVREATGQTREVVRPANPLDLDAEPELRSLSIDELIAQHPAGAYTLSVLLDAEGAVAECAGVPDDEPESNNETTLAFVIEP